MLGDTRTWRRLALIVLGCAGLAACATPLPTRLPQNVAASKPYNGPPPPGSTKGLRGTEKPYQIKGIWYYPKADPNYDERGVGSWYGEQFHNRRTANGEIFDMNLPSAAHKTLPLPSIVEVTNLDNGRKMKVRVNDRGPFVDDRIIDLSRAAADQLGYRRAGIARVRVRYIGPADKTPFDQPRMIASAPPPEPRPTSRQPVPYTVLAAAEPSPPPPAPPPAPMSAPPVVDDPPVIAAPPSGFRVQAGSFANRDNAERAMAQLSQAGQASIEAIERAQGVLYRVVVKAGADEGEAYGMRDRVAALGFSDATVLRP
ncbi:MAG: septal ring lytic transglycosylase RlpA family protein [Caulobacter sp.]|nr:septal ring lytic transglycosylase RlpA family protein [Caulobacter sp.]